MSSKVFQSPVSRSIPFDNSSNGFTSADAQSAIEEVINKNITQEVSATSDTTTTSSSQVLINGMTITPVSGTYFVLFGTSVDHSSQTVAITLSIYVGGVQQTGSIRRATTRTNALGAQSLSQTVTTFAIVTANGSQAIEARWSTPSGTATAHERSMMILRTS